MSVLALDTETNGLDVRYDPDFRMLGVSYSFGGVEEYLAVGHFGGPNRSSSEVLQQVSDLVHRADRVVFHNAKFDLQVLKRGLGLDLWDSNWYDTMLMQHFVNENVFNKSLESLGQLYFREGKERDPEFKKFIEGPGWAFLPVWLTEKYAKQDARLTGKLFEKLYPRFALEGYDEGLWAIEREFVQALSSMEQIGVCIDETLSVREKTMGEKRMAEIVHTLGNLNPSSPKDLEILLIQQLGLPLVKPTKGTRDLPEAQWKPSFDKLAMEEYESILANRDNPTAQLVLEYRGWQKACSTYFSKFIEKKSKDGRIRANFNLHRARTSRLTCDNPNLQQVPRTTDEQKRWNLNTKKCIIPTQQYRLWELDYSNLELRLAAVYSGQQDLIKAFNGSIKIWEYMSELLGGWEKDKTKTTTYATLYGAGVKKLADTMGVSLQESKSARNRYFDTFPKVKWTANTINQGAKDQGYVSLWTGRRRHFPPSESTHKAFNAVLQGGGAECVKRAIIQIWKELTQYNKSLLCKLVLTVHDSIVLEVKRGYEDQFLPRAKEIMEQIPTEFFGMQFTVDVHEWGE